MNDAATSLLTEHFSYTPLSLIDDIINSINNLIYQAISSLESGLIDTPPERLGFAHDSNGTVIHEADEDGNIVYPEAKLEIENGLHQLETLLEANVDKAFDKLEIYVLRNIFTVPEDLLSWVKLKHYEGLSFDNSPDAPTPETIQAQRKKLLETKKLNRALQDECARNDAVISQLKSIISTVDASKTDISETAKESSQLDLSFLTASPAAHKLRVGVDAGSKAKHAPLTTNTAFILSQLPALQSTLAQLRPKLAALPGSLKPMETKTMHDERKEYIESRIRLHLERTGQLAISDDGPVVAGRRIDISEAHALENVASMLARDKKST
ncbi:Centromere protein Mis12 [Penicillium waksmanii]|uniref:Centromere protein Mis12 n=1 Tax=Penicillium waksmanii TaxID=69791 RepID=UPI002546B0CB|nr:Centromere protein Mis12 [Penicillium waksmanii]KAJ5994798.1 Centromere protein Mis12 [Penicillium waksmanii]